MREFADYFGKNSVFFLALNEKLLLTQLLCLAYFPAAVLQGYAV